MIGSSHPFQIGGMFGIHQQPQSGPGVGLPILRHGSGARGSPLVTSILRAAPDVAGANGLTPPQATTPRAMSPRVYAGVHDGPARGRERRRSRGRGESLPAGTRRGVQPPAPRAGIQTAIELEEIVTDLEQRLISTENMLRKHAQEIAVQHEAQSMLEARSQSLCDTIDKTNERMADGGVTIRSYCEAMRNDFEGRLARFQEEVINMMSSAPAESHHPAARDSPGICCQAE